MNRYELEMKLDKLLEEYDYRVANHDDAETLEDLENEIIDLREMIRENY